MTPIIVKQLLDLQRRGIEPFMTDEGWTEFWRIAAEEELTEDISA